MATVSFKDFSKGQPINVIGNESSSDYKKSVMTPATPAPQAAIDSATSSGLIGGTGMGPSGLPTLTPPAPKKDLFPKFEANTSGGASTIPENIAKTALNIPGNIERVTKGVTGAAVDTSLKLKDSLEKRGFIDTLKEVAKKTNTTIDNLAKYTNTSLDKFAADYEADPVKTYSDLAMKLAEYSIENPVDAALAVEMSPAVRGATSAIAREVTDIASDVNRLAIPKPSIATPKAPPVAPVLDEAKMVERYNKAIKPSVTGKGSASKIEAADSRVSDGLKAISENKSSLEFTDDLGQMVKGETPKSVSQLSEAIEQTKNSLFKQYDELAKQAGSQGVSVDSVKIANELDAVITNKALQISNPKAIKYAEDLKDRLTKVGSLDAETAQQVIKNYNESLKAFYRNPSYETASQASIDALIANKFRSLLDEGITGATGQEYQALKLKYGSLASMEKDVARKAANLAKQSNVGMVDTISNIASGAELVRGLATMSPSTIAVSAGIKGLQKYMKYLNDPDVAVKKIFSEIEKSSPSSKGSMLESTATDKLLQASPKSTPFEPKSKLGKGIMEATKNDSLQRGSIKLGSKEFKEIPEATKKEMVSLIDYLRLDKGDSKVMEKVFDDITSKYNISPDLSSAKIANQIEKLVEQTKTK